MCTKNLLIKKMNVKTKKLGLLGTVIVITLCEGQFREALGDTPTRQNNLAEKNEGGVKASPAVTEYVRLTDYAEHKEGEDWAPALKEAFRDSLFVQVPQGRYQCSQVKLSSGSTLQGEGSETVFIPLDSKLFDIAGKAGVETKIAADIVDFSDTILLESDGGLTVGDEIMIRGQRNSMLREGTAGLNYSINWVLGRTRKSSCFFGEMDVVESVAGGRIVTRNKRLFPDYFKDASREPEGIGKGFLLREATTVSKLSMAKNVVLRNFSIEGTSKCSMPIRLSYCKDCLIEDITFTTSVESYEADGDPELSLVYGIYAWNTTIRNFKARLSSELLAILDAKEKVYANFSNYNLFKMISSTGSGFENCEANGGTHAFNITRSASVAGGGGIPSVNCFIRNCIASNCIWSGVKVQQGCYNTDLSGNTVTTSGQGIITGGRNTLIAGNKVDTHLPHSSDYYYTHIARGGTIGIGMIEGYSCGSIARNNTVNGFHSGIVVVDGYEDKNCFEEGDILIENNTVTECLRGFSLYKNPHCMSLGRNDLKIKVVNNSFSRANERAANVDSTGAYLPDRTAGVEISANTFRNFGDGVWMGGFVDFISIDGNLFEGCGIGMTMEGVPSTSGGELAHIKETGNTFIRTERRSQGLAQEHVRAF